MAHLAMVKLVMEGNLYLMAKGAVQLTLRDQFNVVKIRRRGYAAILLETTDLILGDTHRQKYVDAVRLELDRVDLPVPEDLSIEIGHRENLNDPITYVGPFNLTEGFNFIDTRLTARFFRIKISGFSNVAFFVWSTLEFYGRVVGDRR